MNHSYFYPNIPKKIEKDVELYTDYLSTKYFESIVNDKIDIMRTLSFKEKFGYKLTIFPDEYRVEINNKKFIINAKE